MPSAHTSQFDFRITKEENKHLLGGLSKVTELHRVSVVTTLSQEPSAGTGALVAWVPAPCRVLAVRSSMWIYLRGRKS